MPNHSRKKGDPTPAEIRAHCRRIQATWSPQQRSLRRTGMSKPDCDQAKRWQPTIYSLPGIEFEDDIR